jgi:hypothetical protein
MRWLVPSLLALLLATPAQAQSEHESESEHEHESESESESAPPSTCPRTSRQLGLSTAPLLDGMLGVPRRACFRSEIALAGDAYLVAEPTEFYGDIRIGGRLSGSVNLGDLVEI